jgi:RNA polymerase sigma-70 factor (ECF subfamily)
MAETNYILPNEKELFAKMAMSNEAAFTEIFYHYTKPVYNFIFNKTKSTLTTEEIVQEVFIKLWANREQLPEISNYRAYIYTMASNKTYDWLRKMANDDKLKKYTWNTVQSLSNNTEESLNLKESRELISKAVEQLSPQRKKIFLLSRQEGLTRAEIAQHLNLSVNTVNNHLNESLRLVKEYLQNETESSLSLFILLTIPAIIAS